MHTHMHTDQKKKKNSFNSKEHHYYDKCSHTKTETQTFQYIIVNNQQLPKEERDMLSKLKLHYRNQSNI